MPADHGRDIRAADGQGGMTDLRPPPIPILRIDGRWIARQIDIEARRIMQRGNSVETARMVATANIERRIQEEGLRCSRR